MKKWMILALAVLLVLPGCGKKEEAEPAVTPSAASEQQAETTPDTPAEDGQQQQDEQNGETQQPAASLPTGEELADMIDRTNDPDTSEAEKRELLDQIDAILKQAEAQAQ